MTTGICVQNRNGVSSRSALKQNVALAFKAYERAVLEKDTVLAEAAKARFLAASAALKGVKP